MGYVYLLLFLVKSYHHVQHEVANLVKLTSHHMLTEKQLLLGRPEVHPMAAFPSLPLLA